MIEILTLPLGLLAANCHLIKLAATTCLIDPCVRPEQLPVELRPIRWLIATHGHYDHINQADNLRDFTGAPLLIHQADGDCLTQSARNLSLAMQRSTTLRPAEILLRDGQIIDLTDDCQLEVIGTPGHTNGGVCLLLLENDQPQALFTGDTLFAGSIGRTDLDGDPTLMQASLLRLQQLGARYKERQITVFPGHGPATELASEIRDNPYFSMDLTAYF